MNRKNRAGSQLNDPIGRRTKHRKIQCTTATHRHNHYVDLCLRGKLDDLLVGMSRAHNNVDPARIGPFRWNQVIQLFDRRRCRFINTAPVRDLLDHVQQGELGVVLCGQGDRIPQSPLRILREIRTKKNSVQVDGISCLRELRKSGDGLCTASTGQEAFRRTRSVTEPTITRSNPRRP